MANDFLPFANALGANVVTQSAYLAAAYRTAGFSTGIAASNQLNKAWRQSSVMAYVLSQYIADVTGEDVLDNGDLAVILANFKDAVVLGAALKPTRIITSSADVTLLITDYAVGFNRTVAPNETEATLPVVTNANIGQEFVVQDLAGNADTHPIIVFPPAGTSIAGLASYNLVVRRQTASFRYYGANLWSLSI